MLSCSTVFIASLLFCKVLAVPYNPTGQDSASEGSRKNLPSLVLPVIDAQDINAKLDPIGVSNSNRTARFFGLTTGSSGNNLQLGLSFIVPFLNIPFSGLSGLQSLGNYPNTYGTTPAYGTSTSSLLGINSGGIILAVVIGLAAIVLIPLFIYSFTGLNTSPFGRSDNIQDMLSNLAGTVDDALQQYNIDAPSCLQRAICTQVKSSNKRMSDGNGGSFEKIIDGLTTNPYLSGLLEGTRVEEAVNSARKAGTPCSAYFARCPYNIDVISRALSLYAAQYGQKYAADYFSNDVPDL